MARKHNTKHFGRGRSNYPGRLEARGLSKAPTLMPVEQLRNRQERRVRETCTLKGAHDSHKCNGQPWPTRGDAGESDS